MKPSSARDTLAPLATPLMLDTLTKNKLLTTDMALCPKSAGFRFPHSQNYPFFFTSPINMATSCLLYSTAKTLRLLCYVPPYKYFVKGTITSQVPKNYLPYMPEATCET